MADPLGRLHEVGEDAERRVLEVMRSGRFIGGPVVHEAEASAAALFDRAHGVGVGSGTDALMLALRAVGVRAGDEVLIPAMSFFATAGAVACVGAIPVVVDVGQDGCLDPLASARALTARTRAVVPVHLFGSRAVLPDLGVPVVEDSAQAVGLPPTTQRGALTALSCYPTKTWGAAGDAGFVLGDDPELVQRVRSLANHGQVGPHMHRVVHGAIGRNSRIDAMQAAILLAHLPMLPARVLRRRAIAARYDRSLPPGVRPFPRSGDSPSHQYAVLVKGRDQVQARLAAAGVQTAVYYPRSLADQPALERHHPTPVADALAATVLNLPCHPGLSDAHVDRVLTALNDALAP